jgi:DMSO/TMAO reductase YedYZ molybdopterin-dependent catalytic subunit
MVVADNVIFLYRIFVLGGHIMKRIKILLISVFIITALTVFLISSCKSSNVSEPGTTTGEVEATEYLGTKLAPIKDQLNNALAGTQIIDQDTYILTVDGLVDNPLALTYDQLLEYPQESWLMDLNCVEGWDFTAKWTGPQLNSIFDDAGVQPEAKIAIFYTADDPEGYSSLDLDYIRDNNIIIALKLNDITLPNDRGFPFQVVAKEKYGYKWAKWVTRIELSSNTDFRGYWENVGYNNTADVEGPPFEETPQ